MKTKQTMLLLCAWVLWGHDLSADKYAVFSAYEMKAECEVHKSDLLKASPSAFLMCLPDTIDPRGVKGGKP